MVGTRMLHHDLFRTHTEYFAASQARDLADWNRFWNQSDTGSVEGDVRFQGGDLHQRALIAPEKLTAEDYRLRPDSAGYQAGPDGKDLGADIDLVGPGAAYERWKTTPEYQEWLKETGQPRERATAKTESGAFVLQGGGLAERKFDTLADAVRRAIDGDTIEIRGNGPFLSEPVNCARTALTIRAAAGFRPVIQLSPKPAGTLATSWRRARRWCWKAWNSAARLHRTRGAARGPPCVSMMRHCGPPTVASALPFG
jgi:hypothetical protein